MTGNLAHLADEAVIGIAPDVLPLLGLLQVLRSRNENNVYDRWPGMRAEFRRELTRVADLFADEDLDSE